MKKIAGVLLSFLLALPVFSTVLSDINSFDTGLYPRGIVISDINSDGINEVIVANFGEDTLIGQENDKTPTSSISIFYKKGENLIKNDIFAGNSPRGLAVGDLNNDGKEDLVVSNYADNTITIFLQKDNNLVKEYTLDTGKHPVGVAIGKIDENETVIAVAVYSDSKVVVFSPDKKGGWIKNDILVSGNPTDVTIGEINGEKVIVSANYTAGNISIIKKEGGVIKKVKDVKVGGGVCKVEIADVTGDNKNDIITANFYDNTVSVVENNGIEYKQTAVYKLNGSRPNGMSVGDINNDGLNDVVTANRDSDSIDVLIQKNGKLELVKSFVVTNDENKTYGPVEVAIKDINGDGKNDIAFTHMRTNTLRIIYQDKPLPPDIVSASHPDENKWYGDRNVKIEFKAKEDLTGIEGFYYTVSKNKSFSLNDAKFTTNSSVELNNLETGTWFILAAVKDKSGEISDVSEFKVNIVEEMSTKNVYNYPNPCKYKTTIRFPIINPQDVKIIVYDIKGNIVWHKNLTKNDVKIGVNYITWNLINDSGLKVSNGVYILKVITKDKVITKKIAVVE